MFRMLATPKIAESHFDMTYLDRHLPLAEALLRGTGFVRTGVEEGVVLGPPGPAVTCGVMASSTFGSLEASARVMETCGAELSRDFPNLTDVRPLTQVNRVVSAPGDL